MADPAELRAYALAVPAADEQPHFGKASFRVRGKTARTCTCWSTTRRPAPASPRPGPRRWGRRPCGVRVTPAAADGARVRELLAEAWRRKAPKRVVAAFDAWDGGRPTC